MATDAAAAAAAVDGATDAAALSADSALEAAVPEEEDDGLSEYPALNLDLEQTDLLFTVSWHASVKNAVCDLDVACVLLDYQGRVVEIIDFNDPISNDGSIVSGGDTVNASDDDEDMESLFVDLKRLNPKAGGAGGPGPRALPSPSLSRGGRAVDSPPFDPPIDRATRRTSWNEPKQTTVAPSFGAARVTTVHHHHRRPTRRRLTHHRLCDRDCGPAAERRRPPRGAPGPDGGAARVVVLGPVRAGLPPGAQGHVHLHVVRRQPARARARAQLADALGPPDEPRPRAGRLRVRADGQHGRPLQGARRHARACLPT